MKIRVTKKDIEQGKLMNELFCPVALAIKRATGVLWKVNPQAITRWGRKIALPYSVESFIDQFDRSKEVQPFTFNIRFPAPKPRKAPRAHGL